MEQRAVIEGQKTRDREERARSHHRHHRWFCIAGFPFDIRTPDYFTEKYAATLVVDCN